MYDPAMTFIDMGWASANKHHETLCGDSFNVFEGQGKKIYVLSDGLGSGVKANILSTLTATILGTMLSRGIPLDECIDTVALTLPICRVRKLAYSTFTVLQLEENNAYLVQFDNPDAIILRQGKLLSYPKEIRFAGGKEIHESRLALENGDILVLMSDGVTNAGMGKLAINGWGREEVAALLEGFDAGSMSPALIAARIAECCSVLSENSLDDDVTVLVLKLRERQVVNMLIGPPENKEDDNRILKLFFSKAGIRVVCGGSTARAVSAYQNKPLTVVEGTGTEEVPGMGHIDNVDYVTEGIITLKKVQELLEHYLSDSMILLDILKECDGASVLSRLLIEEATDVNIYFGMAANTAHDGTDYDFETKIAIVKGIESCLHKMNKKVRISFC